MGTLQSRKQKIVSEEVKMDDIKRILSMVKEGKITPDEGSRLINALNEVKDSSNAINRKYKWLKILVKSKENSSTKENVNLKIPLNLVKAALKIGGKFSFAMPEEAKDKMEKNGINIKELINPEEFERIIEGLNSGEPYTIVDVEDEDEVVKIFIE